MVASHVRTRALKNMESSLIQSQFGHLLYQQIPSQLYMIVIIAANKTSVVIYCHVTNHPKAQWLKTRRYIVFHDSLGCVFPLLTSPGFIHIVLFSSWRYWELVQEKLSLLFSPDLCHSLSSIYNNRVKYTVFLSSGSHSSKRTELRRGVWEFLIYSWSVRSTSDNLDLHLASEVGRTGTIF